MHSFLTIDTLWQYILLEVSPTGGLSLAKSAHVKLSFVKGYIV